jgi:hypothetical protein
MRLPDKVALNLSRIWVVARHQSGDVVTTSQDNASGHYRRIKGKTYYCAERSLFLDLQGMEDSQCERLLRGDHTDIRASRFS